LLRLISKFSSDYILHKKRLKSISSNRGINYERTIHPEIKKNHQSQWDNNRKFEKAEKEREIYKYNKVVNNTIQKIGETDINVNFIYNQKAL